MKVFFKVLLALFTFDPVSKARKCPDCGVWFPCEKHNNIFNKIDMEIEQNKFSRLFRK